MKSSLIAMTAALALSFGGVAAVFAQEAAATTTTTTAPTTLEECLVQEGAGATPEGDSIATESDTDGENAETTDTPSAQGLEPAVGDAVVCPDTDDSTAN